MAMPRKLLLPILLVVVVLAALTWYFARDRPPPHYTGFVEGEERVLRSEVTGRVLEVAFAEGAPVPADEVVARLDDLDSRSRIASKEHEVAVLDADIATQEERIRLVESTWARDLSARRADLRQAEAGGTLARKTFEREQDLVKTGASTAQLLDDRRAALVQAVSALERAKEMLARTAAEERTIAVARDELDMLHAKRNLTLAQLDELRVTAAKYTIRAPAVATVVQTQFIWPGRSEERRVGK